MNYNGPVGWMQMKPGIYGKLRCALVNQRKVLHVDQSHTVTVCCKPSVLVTILMKMPLIHYLLSKLSKNFQYE